ncbi:MAG: hypothetical protein H0V11_05015 [Actinobacteria bacterium]|nr:hypothetical protein [Actinomycetota bacterium]
MRRLTTLAVACLFAFGGIACGGEEDLAASGAGEAQVEVLENLYDARYDKAWDDLHPKHQQVAPLRLFVRCSAQVAPGGDLESIEVLDVFDDEVVIPGIKEGEAKAVRIRVNSFEGDSDTFVNHQVKVGDKWRWVLNASAVRAYQQQRCPR